jgi:hopene-associated glycosyltransferase HpnB
MLLILSSIALAAWAYLALFRGKFWKATERLLPAPAPSAWPEIVAVIPARNESETIKAAITSHMKSDYPGTFTVVLADDGSEDGTADKARMAPALRPLEIIASPSLAPGWTGKLSAVNAGIERASLTHPEARYWLLTDADIVHAPSTLRRLVAKAEQDELVLVSLMARLDARGFWGGLLIPAFVYFFQKLYPFPLVNDASRPIAAAAGGCMLVRRNALTDAGGIEAISNALIDDCALAAQLKRQGPIWLGIADDEVESLRDNRSLASIWKMVER